MADSKLKIEMHHHYTFFYAMQNKSRPYILKRKSYKRLNFLNQRVELLLNNKYVVPVI